MKKFPSMRSLHQSAASSERQSKTWQAPRPARSTDAWIAAVKLSNPTDGSSACTSTPSAALTSAGCRAKR